MSSAIQIVNTPEVLHGKPRIAGTRIGVLQVGEAVRRNEWTVEETADEFDIDADHVRAALAYYDDHPEVMATLRTQREARKRTIDATTRAE
ncbi:MULTISPECIES: DUF433 domain-containing protein [Halopenitus]|uniref:Uncharacterized conserved protein, DUF433 family n=1 Tax=Halopenitus malekzadehii TaxID=1267564 RepID=A0A1H6IJD3_9EURY|nr:MULTISPECIES: DUF433 domain-containing protein [Halopenitus]SEH48969.1 Uncharacterized conserved protein, DUF433 family [Halopenitus malekzadehii]